MSGPKSDLELEDEDRIRRRNNVRLLPAFSGVAYRVPGSMHKLRKFLELAPLDVVDDFVRLVARYEDEIHAAETRSRMPWRR